MRAKKPLLFSHLTTNIKKDLRLCQKRRPKFGKSFTCRFETDYDTKRIIINPIIYIKLSKHIKSVQEFMLNGSFEKVKNPWTQLKGYLSKISKNLCKVKTLFLEKAYFRSDHRAEWLNTCLNHSKEITRIDACLEGHSSPTNNDDEELNRHFTWILRKAKLQALNLQGPSNKALDLSALAQHCFSKIDYISYTSATCAEELSFKPNKIRRVWVSWNCHHDVVGLDQMGGSIGGRNFDLCWKWENEEEFQTPMSLLEEIIGFWISGQMSQPRSSISDLTNLVALQIDLPIKAEIFQEVLESFPNLSNLIGLKISGNNSRRSRGIEAFALCPQLVSQLLKTPRYLTTLTLDLTKVTIPMQNLTCLLKENTLRELNLNLPVQTENDIDNLRSLTQTLKDTKILSIKILSSEVSFFHPKFDLLLNEIFDLTSLTKIELVWKNSKVIDTKAYSENEISNSLNVSLERLLSKQPQLENLRFHCLLNNENKRYPLLTNIIQRAQGLIKLDIDVGEYMPNQVHFKQIGSLLKNVQHLEVLQLKGFEITQDQDLLDLVRGVYYMHKLRKLKLGRVTNMTLECLVAIKKSLFSFSNIQMFKLEVSSIFYEFLRKAPQYSNIKETEFSGNRPGYVSFHERGIQMILEWQRVEHDVYQLRRGQGTGRGSGRYLCRGRPRVSWFREFK